MLPTTNLIRLFVFRALVVLLLAGIIHASHEAAAASASLTGIKISFKLDPRITRGMYMGDRIKARGPLYGPSATISYSVS